MFSDQTAVDSKPRRRRFWLLLLGIPLLIVILSGVAWVYRTKSALQTAIAEADRSDPHWRLEDIEVDRMTPPQGQNAADKIVAVERLLKPTKWMDANKDELLTNVPPEHQLNDAQMAALNSSLELAGPALAEARSLIDTPSGRHPITYTPDWIGTLLPTVQPTRQVAALLRYDVFAKVQAGDADGAVRSCQALLNSGTSIGDEPILVAQLIRIAIQSIAANMVERTLAQGEPSDAVLAALQARLEMVEAEPLWLYGLRGERAGFDLLLANIGNGTVSSAILGDGSGGSQTFDEVLIHFPGALAVQRTAHIRYMNALIETARLPPEQWAGPLAAQQAQIGQLPLLAKAFVGAYGKVAEACQRNHAHLRCAIVAIAADRFRQQTGNWPATPTDLVKADLLKMLPVDPYAAGQSIKFAHPADGLIVYSTGPDGIDDGGKLGKFPIKPNEDFGIRLWDVSARRQAPLPAKP